MQVMSDQEQWNPASGNPDLGRPAYFFYPAGRGIALGFLLHYFFKSCEFIKLLQSRSRLPLIFFGLLALYQQLTSIAFDR